jgi:hypothetical protein
VRFLVFLLAASAFAAENTVYLDLSGPWRTSQEDSLRFSAPDFDDSGWGTVRVPLGPRLNELQLESPPYEVIWLRRVVGLPETASGTALALTVGAMGPSYRIFVEWPGNWRRAA